MEKIIEKLEKIEKDIEELKIMCRKNGQICEKMSNHIDFVDETYEKFKNPLNTLKDMVSWRNGQKEIKN
jgi:archaellum component FlaC